MRSAEADTSSSGAVVSVAVEAAAVVVSSAPQRTMEEAGQTMAKRATVAEDSAIPEPSIQTYHQVNGEAVKCILNGGEIVIFVQNPQPVHGETSTPQDPKNETGTSPDLQKVT